MDSTRLSKNNNEHCFVHKYFKRDDKALLLEMKRKTRDSNEQKKTQSEVSVAKENEVMKLIKNLQNKVKDQDKKINQLIKTNKEFKNSVMTLYMELEKAKEKEKQIEQIFGVNQNNTKIELSSSDKKITMDYNDFVKIFTNAAENFSKGTQSQPINQNLFYINNTGRNAYKQNFNTNPNKVIQFSIDENANLPNQMIENGSISSPKLSLKVEKEEVKDGIASKLLMSPSNSCDDVLKRINGFNSRPETPRSLLRKESLNDNISELSGDYTNKLYENASRKTPLIPSIENSVISEFDAPKDNVIDNISIYSNSGLGAFIPNTMMNNPDRSIGNFKALSKTMKSDPADQTIKANLSDSKSISEFSSDNYISRTQRKIH